MNSKVVILGSTGFIGSALLTELQEHASLVVDGYHSANLNLLSSSGIDKMSRIVDQETILIITIRSRHKANHLDFFSEYIEMITNIARCLSRKAIKKCVYFSTLSVYGDATTNYSITEKTTISPTNFYGVAKFAGEGVIRQVLAKVGIPLVVLRPCKVYGPGDHSHTYGPGKFCETILREGRVHLFGDGYELRDYIFIRDLVKITTQFVLGEQSGTYNLSAGRSYSFQDIIKVFREITEKEFEVIHLPRDRPKIDQKVDCANLLNVQPNFRFTEMKRGLQETYHYFLSNSASYKDG